MRCKYLNDLANTRPSSPASTDLRQPSAYRQVESVTASGSPSSPVREGWLSREQVLDFWPSDGMDSEPQTVLQPMDDDLRSLCRMALSALEQPQGWMPIESVEKEIEVLVYEEGNGCAVAWLRPDGRWFTSLPHQALRMQPTHWMPLPNPPKGVEG